mmetsp:Transcript_33900/g.55308  ORF Transcript_33900/g.55308 Transcript_33900/m.55308 type:complete len:158 (+) Transcript_33900:622-1095(+)
MPSLEMEVRPEKRGAKEEDTSQTQGKAALPTSPTGDPWAGAVPPLPTPLSPASLIGDDTDDDSPPSSSMAIANLEEMCASEKLTASLLESLSSPLAVADMYENFRSNCNLFCTADEDDAIASITLSSKTAVALLVIFESFMQNASKYKHANAHDAAQ